MPMSVHFVSLVCGILAGGEREEPRFLDTFEVYKSDRVPVPGV